MKVEVHNSCANEKAQWYDTKEILMCRDMFKICIKILEFNRSTGIQDLFEYDLN